MHLYVSVSTSKPLAKATHFPHNSSMREVFVVVV